MVECQAHKGGGLLQGLEDLTARGFDDLQPLLPGAVEQRDQSAALWSGHQCQREGTEGRAAPGGIEPHTGREAMTVARHLVTGRQILTGAGATAE